MATKNGAQRGALTTVGSAVLLAFLLMSCEQNTTASLPENTSGTDTVTQTAAVLTPESAPEPTALSYVEDLALLKAIGRSETFAVVARSKESDGHVVQASTERINLERSEESLDEMQANLELLSSDGLPTYALFHHIDQSGSLSAWLLAPDGGIAFGSSAETYTDLRVLNQGLGVMRMAGFRGARSKGEHPISEAEQRAIRAVDRSPASVAKRSESLTQTVKQLLPGAVGEALGSRNGRLLIIAAKDTGSAPYAALPLSNGIAAENWSFVVLPDIGTLTEEDPVFDRDAIDISNAVIVGDPDLSEDEMFDWDPLPGARKEAKKVADLLAIKPARVLIGSSATRRNLTSAIKNDPDIGMIYMATHAVSDPKNPLTQGFIAMSGPGGHYYAGHIRQEEFAGWDEHHPLVVISACQTALGRVMDAGNFGVARTWTKIGAGQVVASLWNVSDNATFILMTKFVDRLKAGDAPEIAMQVAQIATLHHRKSNGDQPYLNDPKMWASFTVYGKPSLIWP